VSQRYPKRLYRGRDDRMLGGVCGGLGEYFDVDPVLMRLVFVAGTVLSGGLGLAVYVLLWIIVPKEGAQAASRPDVWRQNADEIVAEARRLGSDVRETVRSSRGSEATTQPAEPEATAQAAESTASGPAVGPEAAGADPVPESVYVRPSAASESYAEASPSLTRGYIEPYPSEHQAQRRRQTWAGVVLVVLGLWLLAQNLNLLWWVRGDVLLPLVLLGGGAWLLFRQREGIR
jgi:phage shock protein C